MKLETYNFKLQTTRGATMIIAALFFLMISITITFGVVQPVTSQIIVTRSVEKGMESLYAAEGVSADVTYRLVKNITVDATETIDYGGIQATATTTTVFDGKEVTATGNSATYTRKSRTHLTTGSGVSFNYGMQSGEGGVILENSSSVRGNIYSNGPITGSGNTIFGDVVSAGSSGLINNIHATSSAYAHTIQSSTVDGDAYYQTISGTTVQGTLYPGSSDLATSSLPISDELIAGWKAEATAGGTITSPCEYKITADVTIGPQKINCDLEISGSPTITLTGPLWVQGNITIKNSAIIRVDASLSGKSVPIIADNPSDPDASGIISLENSVSFQGSGANSFVVFISQNNDAETGGGGAAITMKNSVTGAVLVYASHGEIALENSINVKEVTGWRIRIKNSAQVLYETGLTSLLFTGGPAGGYSFDGWREVE